MELGSDLSKGLTVPTILSPWRMENGEFFQGVPVKSLKIIFFHRSVPLFRL